MLPRPLALPRSNVTSSCYPSLLSDILKSKVVHKLYIISVITSLNVYNLVIIGGDVLIIISVYCVFSGVCRKTQLWASIVDFPPGFETARENEVVKVSCKEQYDNRTFRLTCVKNSDVFQFYPHPEPSSCTRKNCSLLTNPTTWNCYILYMSEILPSLGS